MNILTIREAMKLEMIKSDNKLESVNDELDLSKEEISEHNQIIDSGIILI